MGSIIQYPKGKWLQVGLMISFSQCHKVEPGTLFLGSVIVPIFCETSGEREVSVNSSPGAWRHKTQTERQSESFLQMYGMGGRGACTLYVRRCCVVWQCQNIGLWYPSLRLINVLFAIFYIFIHFIEFPRRFMVTLNIFWCFWSNSSMSCFGDHCYLKMQGQKNRFKGPNCLLLNFAYS